MRKTVVVLDWKPYTKERYTRGCGSVDYEVETWIEDFAPGILDSPFAALVVHQTSYRDPVPEFIRETRARGIPVILQGGPGEVRETYRRLYHDQLKDEGVLIVDTERQLFAKLRELFG